MKKDFYSRALQRDLWDPNSAALYLLGIDPESVAGKNLAGYVMMPKHHGLKAPAKYKDFQHHKQAVLDAIRAVAIPSVPSRVLGELPSVVPADLIAWARKKGFEIPKQFDLVSEPAQRTWPWGSHDTKHLQHLAAAAEKFWKGYDTQKPEAAPKNAVVTQWLIRERKVSRRMAEIMAQILRHEGIPDGPRRKAGK